MKGVSSIWNAQAEVANAWRLHRSNRQIYCTIPTTRTPRPDEEGRGVEGSRDRRSGHDHSACAYSAKAKPSGGRGHDRGRHDAPTSWTTSMAHSRRHCLSQSGQRRMQCGQGVRRPDSDRPRIVPPADCGGRPSRRNKVPWLRSSVAPSEHLAAPFRSVEDLPRSSTRQSLERMKPQERQNSLPGQRKRSSVWAFSTLQPPSGAIAGSAERARSPICESPAVSATPASDSLNRLG